MDLVGSVVPTIGIVTALPIEFAAMKVLIDDAQRQLVAGDRAEYAVGTLPSALNGQPHIVVLPLLGDSGNKSAAEACANLSRSFPSVNCVVMSGIAAGVPAPDQPKRHVRLGDIVVATDGIVDYDHVRVLPGQTTLRRPPVRPSTLLSRAAHHLQVAEINGERPWERLLDTKHEPRLRPFRRPSPSTDLLNATDNASRRRSHPRRDASGHRPGLPKVHYGLIGSADRLLRDAVRRDELAAEHGVLALEMEGAGIASSSLLQGMEWFVVRGISDYADSGKNDLWHGHAALAAASYVRVLLGACPPLAPRGGHTLAPETAPTPQRLAEADTTHTTTPPRAPQEANTTGWRLDLDPDLDTHWWPRARGVEPDAESEGWYFTGRELVLRELAEWLAAPVGLDRRMRVLTG